MWLCERKTATLIGLLIDQIPFKIILAFQLFLVCLFVLSANLTLVQWFLLSCDCVSVVCISSFFTACFYYFLFERYLNSSMTGFLSDILLPFLNSNDLMKSQAQPLIMACSIRMFQKFDWLKQPPDSLKTSCSVTKKLISQELTDIYCQHSCYGWKWHFIAKKHYTI